MRTTQELIAVTMTALTALSNRLGEGSKPIRDIDIAMDNHQDIISDGEELDRLMEEHSIDADELNQEFPPEQYTDGHVVEVIKERLDRPEAGKKYSLLELSKTKKWSESEVIEDVQIEDIDMTNDEFDALFEGI